MLSQMLVMIFSRFSLSILSEESLRDRWEADFPGPDYSQLFFSNSELEPTGAQLDPIRAHWSPDGPLKRLIKLDSSNHALTNAGNDIFPVRPLGQGSLCPFYLSDAAD